MKIDFLNSNGHGYEETGKIICSYDEGRECELEFQVTGGLNEDIELRVCYEGEDTFELDDNGKNVVIIKLYDLVRAAANWEEGKFIRENNKSNAMKAIVSHLRHTANILEIEALDVEKNSNKNER